jgi:hypothetical protein
MTADIEFLAVLSRAILALMILSGGAIATILVVILILKLFGCLDD